MVQRPRRLRTNSLIRDLSRETRISQDALVLPIFVKEGTNVKKEIPSLNNHYHFSPDTVHEVIDYALNSGVNKFLIFGLPLNKDDAGSQAYATDGVVQQALHKIKGQFHDQVLLITDVCLCEYTSHGHCGILEGNNVDNDKSLVFIAKTALSHAQAGADLVAPSDMMDGRVAAIRTALDDHKFKHVPIMSYAVKYASSFYGPFREAAGSAPAFGDRKSYQMDYHNKKEAIKEALLDIEQGADILIVKPALAYLDIIQSVSQLANVPVAAYNVSGEYAMCKAAAHQGLVDGHAALCEMAVSMFRAGAQILISYGACELAKAIKKGDIG